MAEINNVSTSVGIDGNKYTTAVTNDQLTTNDFLKLMIQELKLQDPTKPMDSARMLDTQMKMSTLNGNMEMVKAMQSIQTAFNQSSLSTATGIIGKHVENGQVAEDGVTSKAFVVRSIENIDGDIKATVQRMLYLEQVIIQKDPNNADAKPKMINYDAAGNIFNEKGERTGEKVVLTNPGVPLIKDGNIVILDEAGDEVASHNFSMAGESIPVYSDATEQISFSSITKIF